MNLRSRGLVFSLILSVVFLIVYVYIFDKKLDLNGDNVSYYLLGRSLANGTGYVNTAQAEMTPHKQYPPAYPFLMSMIIKASGGDQDASILKIKIVNGLFFWLALLVCLKFFLMMGTPPLLGFAAVFLLALNSVLLKSSMIMMTEIPFMLSVILALYFVSKSSLDILVHRDKWFLLGILFMILAYYIRTQGISLFFGMIVYLAFRKRWKYVAATVAAIAMLTLPWYIHGKKYGGNPYMGHLMLSPYDPEKGLVTFSDMAERVFSNIWRYFSIELPGACFPAFDILFRKNIVYGILAGAALTYLVLLGIYKLGKNRSLMISYVVGVLGLCMVLVSAWYGPRFITSIIPFLTFLWLIGLWEVINKRIAVKIPFKLSPLLLLLAGFLFVKPIMGLHDYAEQSYPPNWRNYFKTASYIKEHAPKNAFISCRKPGFFYLFSERHTTNYLYSWDDKNVFKDLIKNDIDYVVVEQLGYASTGKYLIPAINKNSYAFEKILHLKEPDTYLFKTRFPKTMEGRVKTVAASLNTVAYENQMEKKFDKAIKFYRNILQIYKDRNMQDEILGKACFQLGTISYDQKKYSQGAEYFKKAIAIFEKTQTEDAKYIAKAYSNLGVTYQLQRRYREAEQCYRKGLELSRKSSGDNHHDIGITTHNLANIYWKLGNLSEAEKYLKWSMKVWQQNPRKYLSRMKSIVGELIKVYTQAKKRNQAYKIYDYFLRFVAEKFGEHSKQHLRELKSAAEFYRNGKDLRTADILDRKLKKLQERHGPVK